MRLKQLLKNKWMFAALVFGLLVVLILVTALNAKVNEAFVPKVVRESYRPLERKVRNTCEEMYSKTMVQVSNWLRRANWT
jgi:hypothetical protein